MRPIDAETPDTRFNKKRFEGFLASVQLQTHMIFTVTQMKLLA